MWDQDKDRECEFMQWNTTNKVKVPKFIFFVTHRKKRQLTKVQLQILKKENKR